jgi:hypothetical protein
MEIRHLKYLILFGFSSFFFNFNCIGQSSTQEQHLKVSLRMIGHQVLLCAGDSTSRVLPIEKIDNRFRIQFDTSFDLNPDDLVRIVDSIVLEAKLANSYLVEVQQSNNNLGVYAFEAGNAVNPDIIPCRSRPLPNDQYEIYFTILDSEKSMASFIGGNTTPISKAFLGLFLFLGLLAAGLIYFYYTKKKITADNDDLISIGGYKFDKISMELSFADEKTELSSKEADLLYLLYSSANTTIERDVILQKVWKDEGDYIGRTVDVFISKLRKRLEADPSLKIVNVRGVGYKFVMGV